MTDPDLSRIQTDLPVGKRRRWGLIIFFWLILVPAGLFAAYTWFTLTFSYSTGERAGYIQKISKKGWICKTWEGELAMVNLPGAMPQIFAFSVKDDAVARAVTETLGRRVMLTYEEHRGIPTNCFGETAHFVTNVQPIDDASALPTLPVGTTAQTTPTR